MSSSSPIPQALWNARIPLHVTHPSSPTTPFITSVPRFSYLALLLPRLSAFFGSPCSSFHFEDVQLRNLAVGLLVDLYRPSLPWRLTVNDGVGWDIADTFLNCVKEVSVDMFSTLVAPRFHQLRLGMTSHSCLLMLISLPRPYSDMISGRLHPQWQRKPNHENVQRQHDSTLERSHRQRLRFLQPYKQQTSQRPHSSQAHSLAHLHPNLINRPRLIPNALRVWHFQNRSVTCTCIGL